MERAGEGRDPCGRELWGGGEWPPQRVDLPSPCQAQALSRSPARVLGQCGPALPSPQAHGWPLRSPGGGGGRAAWSHAGLEDAQPVFQAVGQLGHPLDAACLQTPTSWPQASGPTDATEAGSVCLGAAARGRGSLFSERAGGSSGGVRRHNSLVEKWGWHGGGGGG